MGRDRYPDAMLQTLSKRPHTSNERGLNHHQPGRLSATAITSAKLKAAAKRTGGVDLGAQREHVGPTPWSGREPEQQEMARTSTSNVISHPDGRDLEPRLPLAACAQSTTVVALRLRRLRLVWPTKGGAVRLRPSAWPRTLHGWSSCSEQPTCECTRFDPGDMQNRHATKAACSLDRDTSDRPEPGEPSYPTMMIAYYASAPAKAGATACGSGDGQSDV